MKGLMCSLATTEGFWGFLDCVRMGNDHVINGTQPTSSGFMEEFPLEMLLLHLVG